jgi:diguanylate cyclase (GGDEF)-like protein
VLAGLPTAGILLVSVAVAVCRPLASTPTYYLLPLLASAYFGRPRRLAVELGVFAGSLALVLAVWAETPVASAVFLGTAIPGVCVAVVVAGLKQRLDEHVDGLRDLASTDALTGLLNHGAFAAELERALERCDRTGEPATLLLIDLDHFKRINDRFGHQEGDRMLRVVSDVLAAHRRRDDLLGRVGGEEFALLLPGADAAVAEGVAGRVRSALRAATASASARLTLSVGIASRSAAVTTSHTLLHAADQALYAAKARGRDRAVAFAAGELSAAA